MSRDLTDALSKLYIKLGGETGIIQENKNVMDYIDDITSIVTPGGGGGETVYIYINIGNDGAGYKDPDFTERFTVEEYHEAFLKNAILVYYHNSYRHECRSLAYFDDGDSTAWIECAYPDGIGEKTMTVINNPDAPK